MWRYCTEYVQSPRMYKSVAKFCARWLFSRRVCNVCKRCIRDGDGGEMLKEYKPCSAHILYPLRAHQP